VGEWLGVAMFISCFDAATATRIVEEAGFRIDSAGVETRLEGGRPEPFLWVLGRRAADAG
jgi:hypothetical protein